MPSDALLAEYGFQVGILPESRFAFPVRVERTHVPLMTVQQAKDHSRAFDGSQDPLFEIWVDTASRLVLERCGRAGVTETVTFYYDRAGITGQVLTVSPYVDLTSVTSIYEGTETSETTSNFFQRRLGNRNVLCLKRGFTYTAPYDEIKVVITTGYGTATDDVPSTLKYAAMVIVDYAYQHGVMPDGIPEEVEKMLGAARLIVPH